MYLHRIFVAALLASLCACNTVRDRSPTDDGHPSGWHLEIREAAVRAYSYAQMSTNAYAGKDSFDLGSGFETLDTVDNDRKGFAYSIFARRGETAHGARSSSHSAERNSLTSTTGSTATS